MEIQVPLKFLKLGEEEGINARVAGREEDIDALAANLFVKGQIENLVVKRFDETFYSVSNGNRRLRAFQKIHGPGSDVLINCTLRDVDVAGAFEDSMTTAITAKQLHPVDQYEAFARLRDAEQTEEEIARKFGLTEKEVRQALALGRLHPKIRDAWREGHIRAEVAQAFTLSLDLKTQDRLFAKLQKESRLNVGAVREELCGETGSDGALVNFVGLEAYQSRGGTVAIDLFKDNHIVSDMGLLNAMVDERLQAECIKLVEGGWNWASRKDDLPASWRTWPVTRVKIDKFLTADEASLAAELQQKIAEIENDEDAAYDATYDLEQQLAALERNVVPRCFTDKQKAKLGCALGVENDGTLIVEYGIARPAVSSAKAAAAMAPTAGQSPEIKETPAKGENPEAPDISNALKHRLSVQLTRGTAAALVQDPELALVILLAAFASEGTAVRANMTGLGSSTLELTDAYDIADNIKLFKAMKITERLEMVAAVVSAALDFQNLSLDGDKYGGSNDVRAICNSLDPASLNAALRGAFDAKDYFAGVNKALCLAAIKEAFGADAARQQSGNSKAEIAAFAQENVPQTGWLPPQLRAAGYDGPPVKQKAAGKNPVIKKTSAKSPSKKPAKKATKKKSKR